MAKNRDFSRGVKHVPYDQDAPLADRLNYLEKANRGIASGGRGHGRLSAHGRGKKVVPLRGKKDSIHFLEACVTSYRLNPTKLNFIDGFFADSNDRLDSTTDWANLLSRQTQYFDCDVIWDYIYENYKNMYPDKDVPPSPDCVLPAENVALYLSKFMIQPNETTYYHNPVEMLLVCVPHNTNLESTDPYFRRQYYVFMITYKEQGVYGSLGTYDSKGPVTFTQPLPLGSIIVADTEEGSDHVFEHLLLHTKKEFEFIREEAQETLRIAAAMLQTINQPRYVKRSQRDVSQIKRQRIKNSLGRYIPDAWNMISWNVDEPVMAKTSDEGTGSRQGLHYRRGHWRKAESHWAGARWSETRLRWETYIHGYEAGHPKFGVLKSYHVPRKDKK